GDAALSQRRLRRPLRGTVREALRKPTARMRFQGEMNPPTSDNFNKIAPNRPPNGTNRTSLTMDNHPDSDSRALLHAQQMSRFKKERHLLQLSEDDFRDLVVRPLLLRLGLQDGRDLCGPDEEGKDTIFFQHDVIRKRIMIALQTKKGNINMSRK